MCATALSLLTESQAELPLRIPAFHCVNKGEHGGFEPDGELIVSTPLQHREVIVEGKVRAGFLSRISSVPNELLDLKPDIIIGIDDSVIIVEVKTVGHELGSYQKNCYEKLAHFLRGHGYEVDLY